MKIIKRNGSEAVFDITKIIAAVTKANKVVPDAQRLTKQQIIEISDGSAIRLSTHSFLTPNRVDISLNGVVPDSIVYNSDPSTVGTTEGTTGGSSGTASSSNDEQLIAALKLLSQTSF